MAKLSLLDITQDILSDLDSDEVNSISDTTESLQVAQIVKTTYLDLMTRKYHAHLKTLLKLDSTSSSTPTHMKLPVDVMELKEVNYDKKTSTQTDPKFKEVNYMEDIDFLIYTNARNSDNSNVDVVSDPTGVDLKIINDTAPQYWTSFDDEYAVFDSYDSEVESNLQNSKTQIIGYREPTLVLADGSVPDLPSESFPYLVSEAKKHCLAKLKQVDLSDTSYREEVERNSKQNTWLRRKGWRTNTQSKYPNYGRS